MEAEAPGHLIVGYVQKPHGIKGELMVKLETDRPAEVFAPGRVLPMGDAEGRPTGEVLTLERARPFKGGILLKVAEHTGRSPEQEALRGRTLLLPLAEVPPPAEDEVFYHDLVGLRVEAHGGTVGTVREVYEMPAGVMLGVTRPGAAELLVPFVREMVKRVDVPAGVLELDPPPGLLDL
jgi:16S rRNA processing protein RimM